MVCCKQARRQFEELRRRRSVIRPWPRTPAQDHPSLVEQLVPAILPCSRPPSPGRWLRGVTGRPSSASAPAHGTPRQGRRVSGCRTPSRGFAADVSCSGTSTRRVDRRLAPARPRTGGRQYPPGVMPASRPACSWWLRRGPAGSARLRRWRRALRLPISYKIRRGVRARPAS